MISLCLTLLTVAGSPQVTGFDGTRHRPLEEAGHHPSILVFISHDCPICNVYAPELQRIAKKYARAHVSVSLVYTEPGITTAVARAHAKAYSYSSPHLYIDPRGTLSKYVGAAITPEAAVYDGRGKLSYLGRIDDLYLAFGKQRTKATSHDLRNAIDAVLAHRKVANAHTAPVGCYIATELK